MKLGRLLCRLVLLMPLYVLAEESRLSVAVNDFLGKGVATEEAEVISDRLRSELVKTGAFRVMERGEMETILKEQGFQQSGLCDDAACLVEVGQLLGVSQMLAGTIGKIGNMFTISARMIKVSTGEVVSVANADIRGTIDLVLTEATKQIALELSGKKASSAGGAAAPLPIVSAQSNPAVSTGAVAEQPKAPATEPVAPERRKAVMVGFGLSVVLPGGRLGEDDFGDFSLMGGESGGGFAKSGFGAQFDMFIRPWHAPLALRFQLGYQRNMVDVGRLEESVQWVEDIRASVMGDNSRSVSVEVGAYNALPVLWGLQLQLGRKFGFYVEGLAGICITASPWIYVEYYDWYGQLADWEEPSINADASFAFTGAIGVVLARHLDIGVRYMLWSGKTWAPAVIYGDSEWGDMARFMVLKPTIAVRF